MLQINFFLNDLEIHTILIFFKLNVGNNLFFYFIIIIVLK